jgi:hypothetical protein
LYCKSTGRSKKNLATEYRKKETKQKYEQENEKYRLGGGKTPLPIEAFAAEQTQKRFVIVHGISAAGADKLITHFF